jgi:hypothetical protein
MADLSSEEWNALARLISGQVDYDAMNDESLFALAAAAAYGRETLYQVTRRLNDRGHTFSEIGQRLGVAEATASRWAKPPAADRRRRRGEQGQ